MADKNPRINITLENSILVLLDVLAKRENKSISALTKNLILEALDWREEKMLTALAAKRDLNKAKRLKNKDIWE